MSFLGDVFGGVKNAVVGAGHAVGSAVSNPWVQGALATGLAATGVGAPLAAGIMGGTGLLGGALKPGGNLGSAVGGGLTGAISGYGAGKLGDVLHGGGSLLDKAGGVFGALKGGGGGGNALGGLGGLASGGGGGGGVSPAVMTLAGLQAANAASLGKTANDYSDKAWNLSNDSYASRAGLRDAGIKGLLANKAPDLSGLSAIRAQNPVAARAGGGPPSDTGGGMLRSALAPPPPPMPGNVGGMLPQLRPTDTGGAVATGGMLARAMASRPPMGGAPPEVPNASFRMAPRSRTEAGGMLSLQAPEMMA